MTEVDLSEVPTKAIRAELMRREEAERSAEWQAIAKQFPCPECGAAPSEVKREGVEEFRLAPRSADGEVMLHAAYESHEGTTAGIRWETTVTCENGHITTSDEIRWVQLTWLTSSSCLRGIR